MLEKPSYLAGSTRGCNVICSDSAGELWFLAVASCPDGCWACFRWRRKFPQTSQFPLRIQHMWLYDSMTNTTAAVAHLTISSVGCRRQARLPRLHHPHTDRHSTSSHLGQLDLHFADVLAPARSEQLVDQGHQEAWPN